VATPAASAAFPETGIGIYPGLGGMLRLGRQVGAPLAKYYTFTGMTLRAQDLQALGIAARLVPAAETQAAIEELTAAGKPDKYAPRDLPAAYQPLAAVCAPENVDSLFAGRPLAGVDAQVAEKAHKAVGGKAPLALRLANEIIDQQVGQSMEAAIEIELGRLEEIFATADALEGLSSVGRRRPQFKGA
jgi:enoyl-CoA hydratase/3-hydroxyacyl-CoA dehydrogenase